MFNKPPHEGETLRKTAARFQRIINKIVRMSQSPREFGTGELLLVAEIQIIHTVGINPNTTVTELSRQLGLTKGTVSPIVNGLVERDYLKKARSSQDGRKLKLELTNKGETASQGYEKYAEEYVSQYAQEISYGEWVIVSETLVKLEAFVDTKIQESP